MIDSTIDDWHNIEFQRQLWDNRKRLTYPQQTVYSENIKDMGLHGRLIDGN